MKKFFLASAFSALIATPALAHNTGFNASGSANSGILGGSISGTIGNGYATGFSDATTSATSQYNNSGIFNDNGINTTTTGSFDSGAKSHGQGASASTGLGAASASGTFNTGKSSGRSGW